MKVIRYDSEGRIFSTVTSGVDDAFINHLRNVDSNFVTAADLPERLFTDWYVASGELRPRPSHSITLSKDRIVADDVDEAVLTGLPSPATLSIDGIAYEIVGGSVEFATPMPGTYVIEINHWPYLPFSAEIVAS